jgi:hypothetical protein
MARTRKRRSKHRGTQAGTVEKAAHNRGSARAAASRPRTKAEAREEARRRRIERLDRPPTWKGAAQRAGIAAALLAVLAVTLLGQTVPQALLLASFMLLIYIPLGYLFDGFVYRLRQRRKSGAGGGRG